MINLLSEESKNELKAARRNVIFRKYIFTLLFLAFVIAGSYGVGYGLLLTQESTYKQQIAEFEPQKAQYSDTIKKANEYNKNLIVAKSILQNELSFSAFTTMVAKTTPSSVIASSLTIKASELTKPVEFTFTAKSYEKVLETKDTFERSPYFKDVKIRSITKQLRTTYQYQFVLITTFDRTAFNKDQKEGII